MRTWSDKQRTWLVAGLLGLLALALYWFTLIPSIPATDSGELILAAWLPGIAHAPGFPLWVVLGWLFSHLIPLGSVAQRLNWMSAFFGALAVMATFWLAILGLPWRQLVPVKSSGSRPETRDRGTRQALPHRAPAAAAPRIPPTVWTAAVVGTLAFALARTIWSWSVVAEVYALHVFLVAAILALLLAWRQRLTQGEPPVRAGRWLILAAGVYGLALGNHNLTIGLLAPAILWWLWVNRRGLTVRVFLLATAALAAGLLIYLYLPLRAAQDPLLNWGDPFNLTRLWWHITGRQYQVNIFGGTLATMARQLGEGAVLWVQQFTPLGVLFSLLGLGVLWRRDRALLGLTLLVAFFGVAYAVVYEIADDRDAYYLATFVVSALWLACGLYGTLEWVAARRPNLVRPAMVAVALLPLLVLAWNWRVADHRHYTYPATYAQNALDEAEAGALILTSDWQLYAPLLTLQHVDGQRPDVATLDMLLFQNRPWYHDQVQQKYPDLVRGVVAEQTAFLEKLRQFEAGELPADDREIGPRYQTLLRALLDQALASRPVYATPDALAQLEQFGIDLQNQVVPGAVLMRVLPSVPSAVDELTPARWNIQPFLDAAANGTYLDEPAQKVRRSHAGMSANRGTYYARLNRWADAVPGYAQAIAIDPSYVTGYLLLAEAQQRAGDIAAARQTLESALTVDPGNAQVQQRLAALGAP